jgi:hypothetical protein
MNISKNQLKQLIQEELLKMILKEEKEEPLAPIIRNFKFAIMKEITNKQIKKAYKLLREFEKYLQNNGHYGGPAKRADQGPWNLGAAATAYAEIASAWNQVFAPAAKGIPSFPTPEAKHHSSFIFKLQVAGTEAASRIPLDAANI